MIDFKGSQFEKEIILWGVRWYRGDARHSQGTTGGHREQVTNASGAVLCSRCIDNKK